jgi:hypothetical protein
VAASPSAGRGAAVAAQVAAEAAETSRRRRAARSCGRAQPLSVAEAIQTAMVAEPEDLIRTVRRVHPEMWQRVIRLGRARGENPGMALYAAIEAGLKQLGVGS